MHLPSPRRRFTLLAALSGLALAALPLPGAFAKPGSPGRNGEIYLYRGLANVFSTGIDVIGRELREQGANARVFNHTAWQLQANDLVRRSKQQGGISYPVIIMGHSFGADCSIRMANYLAARGIKVAYVATFDPTHHSAIGPQVSCLHNFFVAVGKDGPESYRYVRKAPGFRGTLVNRNLGAEPQYASLHHFNIEKDPRIQRQVIAKALSLTGRKRS